jgi:hypothetical protein
MQVYAYQARDAQHMAWSAELHERAERKLEEVMGGIRAAGKMSKGTRGSPIKGARVDSKPTLADQDIDGLARRINAVGLLHPVVVRPDGQRDR